MTLPDDLYRFEGWLANLSDGTTVHETPPVPGERTSWQKLLKHCKDNGVEITRLRLFRSGVWVIALPEKGCEGYFQAYEASRSWFSNQLGNKQGIGSVVGDKVYIVWVSTDGQVYQDVRTLESMRIHTTLQ